jgi:hypothetical protein
MKRTPHRNPGFISAQVNSIGTITRINFSVLRIIARIITPILGSISDHTTHRSPTPEPVTVVTVVVVVVVVMIVIMTAVIVAALVVAATMMTSAVTSAMAVRNGDRSALQNTQGERHRACHQSRFRHHFILPRPISAFTAFTCSVSFAQSIPG